jgi:hypothetical protein
MVSCQNNKQLSGKEIFLGKWLHLDEIQGEVVGRMLLDISHSSSDSLKVDAWHNFSPNEAHDFTISAEPFCGNYFFDSKENRLTKPMNAGLREDVSNERGELVISMISADTLLIGQNKFSRMVFNEN